MLKRLAGGVARALTIAGSDSGGGAGIQADLKTFSAFDVYGLSALTAVTAQNTLGVQGVHTLDPTFVQLQLQSVLSDVGADAIKTGMLANAESARAVAAQLAQSAATVPLVVDPVMIAKGGASLLESDAVASLRDHLFPLATVVTPNIPEAEALCEFPLTSAADCVRAARKLHKLGPAVVVIKGGHATWNDRGSALAADLVFDGETVTWLVAPRIRTERTHGTGCTFSAAITASLASGMPAIQAIAKAKAYVADAIQSGSTWQLGQGHGPLDHSVAPAEPTMEIQPGHTYLWNGVWSEMPTNLLE